jgi:hypothetical protein
MGSPEVLLPPGSNGVIPEYTIDYTQKNVKYADAELQWLLNWCLQQESNTTM